MSFVTKFLINSFLDVEMGDAPADVATVPANVSTTSEASTNATPDTSGVFSDSGPDAGAKSSSETKETEAKLEKVLVKEAGVVKETKVDAGAPSEDDSVDSIPGLYASVSLISDRVKADYPITARPPSVVTMNMVSFYLRGRYDFGLFLIFRLKNVWSVPKKSLIWTVLVARWLLMVLNLATWWIAM